MTKTQRNVSDKLGKNIIDKHEMIYNKIEKRIGKTKKCNFGHTRGSKTGVKHEGIRDIPIRDFELRGCSVLENGEIVIKDDGLQGFCKTCSKRRRRKRLDMAREKNKDGYNTYEKEYGKKIKRCSSCKEEKDIRKHFALSPGMECGIHNICRSCNIKYGKSMGSRFIKYRPDGNYTYNKYANDLHDDHMMPLAYGGTNEKINHQLIPSKENMKKSSTIPFDNIMHINPLLLSKRWRPILYQAQREKISINTLKSRISSAILEEQKTLYSMTDAQLENVFKEYNKTNNRRVNTERCVRKFRKYCRDILHLD